MKYNLAFLSFLFLTLLFSCQDDDLNCLNGGELNGSNQCNCPLGFMGEDCSIEQTAKRFWVRKVSMEGFPATDLNDQPWDDDGNADLRLRLTYSENINDGLFATEKIEDANPNNPQVFDINFSHQIELSDNVDTTFYFYINDVDSNGTEQTIGTFEFKPAKKPYQSEMLLQSTFGLDFPISVELEYQF